MNTLKTAISADNLNTKEKDNYDDKVSVYINFYVAQLCHFHIV